MSAYWWCPNCEVEGPDGGPLNGKTIWKQHTEESPTCDSAELMLFIATELPPYLREWRDKYRERYGFATPPASILSESR